LRSSTAAATASKVAQSASVIDSVETLESFARVLSSLSG
jgi:hypothetical protein